MQDKVMKALDALRRKDFATARDHIAAYAHDNALEFQHYLIKGLAELALLEYQSAHDTFAEASYFFPHQAQIWFNLGVAQENLGLIDEAADSFEHSLAINPNQGEACGNLSNIYRKRGRLREAEQKAHQAYELGAPRAAALNTLGLALAKQGKFEAAQSVYKESLQFEANNPLVMANLANLYVDQLRFVDAWPLFSAARLLAPTIAAIKRDEGMARLLAGDYVAGWPLYEARLELPTALSIQPNCPRYAGEPVAGKKILLIAEQGFGDAIQFCRYGKNLVEMGATIVWSVRAPLERLFTENLGGQLVVEGSEITPCDFYIPLMSLPQMLRFYRPENAPRAPYLKALSQPLLPKRKNEKMAIGLVWAGSPTHERDHERSLLLEQLKPVLRKLGGSVQFYAPFTGSALDEIEGVDDSIIALDNLITDFADTAALLLQLDLLITVDTSTAHLAGALGVPTYLLLPHCPDWRWGIVGETTPWYPSITLIRQPYYGDWQGAIEKLVEQLG
jgi:Flp pilus assembly protein TadD